jgi:hypothetical protein
LQAVGFHDARVLDGYLPRIQSVIDAHLREWSITGAVPELDSALRVMATEIGGFQRGAAA